MTASFLDIILLVFLAYFAVSGLIQGFCKEVFSILGLVGGLWLAYTYHGLLDPHLAFISKELWRTIASYFIIFIGVNIIANILAHALKTLLTLAMLPWADRMAGLILGLAKGLLLCSVVALVLQKFFADADFMQNSFLLPYLSHFIENIREYIPDEIMNATI